MDALTKVIRSTEIQTWRRDHLYGCEVDDVAFALFLREVGQGGAWPSSSPHGAFRFLQVDASRIRIEVLPTGNDTLPAALKCSI